MTGSRNAPASVEAADAKILAALAPLARRGRHVRSADLEDGRASVPIRNGADAEGAAVAHASREALHAALARGWIAVSTNDASGSGELCLTRAGRERMRRARADQSLAHASTTEDARPAIQPLPVKNVAESPLGWLRGRRGADGKAMISDAQFDAGERLRNDLTLAGLTPRVTMSWSGIPGSPGARSGGGLTIAEAALAARQRVTRALEAVGPEHAGILIDVCGHLKGLEAIATAEGWPRRSAKLVLQRALDALARHYGLLPTVTVAQAMADRIRHWGGPDYRPTLARWREADQAG